MHEWWCQATPRGAHTNNERRTGNSCRHSNPRGTRTYGEVAFRRPSQHVPKDVPGTSERRCPTTVHARGGGVSICWKRVRAAWSGRTTGDGTGIVATTSSPGRTPASSVSAAMAASDNVQRQLTDASLDVVGGASDVC